MTIIRGKYMRMTTLIAVFAFCTVLAKAQPPIRLSVHPQIAPDSLDIDFYGKKNPALAVGEVVGLNIGVWSFDHFVRNTDYSEISWSSIKENFKEGFKWDNDAMGTNMFMHPYHGNLYFNAARTNGYNFWQSSLFAFGGSAMWEMCMENEYPSTNDIIATPVGGTAIGEVAYRATDIILDDSSTGLERLGREAAVFIISPMRGLTRIINGNAWRHRTTPGRRFGIPNIAIEASLGARVLGFKNSVADEGMGLTTELNLEYGDRFESRSKKPYDYFTLKLDLAAQKSQPVLSELNIMGRLLSHEVIDQPYHSMNLGMYQHYDFYDSDTLSLRTNKTPYKLAIPASVGTGLMYRYKRPYQIAFDAYAHINGILLGGVLSDHYEVDDRNYNLGSGFSIKTGINLVVNRDIFSVQLGYEYYRLYTWGYPRNTDLTMANPRTLNAEGDQSVAYFGVGDLRFDLKLMPRLYLTGAISHYIRSTRYRDFDNVRSATFAARLMLTYKL